MKLKREEVPQLVGQIINIFEEFLNEKGIYIENDERCGDIGESIIYGSDYGELQSSLEQLLDEWDLVRKYKED